MKGTAKCYGPLREYVETIPLISCHDHFEQLGPNYEDPIQFFIRGYMNCDFLSVSSENDISFLSDTNLSLEKRDFNVVIGNPPWVSGKHQKDKDFVKWQKINPKKPCPSNQIAHGFMWEAPKYVSEEGVACLLLPAGVLFNGRTNKFQAE